MSDHQLRIERFMHLAGQEVPDRPTMPSLQVRELRARLILEETLETIKALGFRVYRDPKLASPDAPMQIDTLKFEDCCRPNLVLIADGCADISVVTTGTLSACGIKDDSLLKIVDENNLAKFGPGGYRREDGKWIKPPDHRPPDIQGEINRQLGITTARFDQKEGAD